MAGRSKRRRFDEIDRSLSERNFTYTFPQGPGAPVTDEARQRWKGFCEIESEPAGLTGDLGANSESNAS